MSITIRSESKASDDRLRVAVVNGVVWGKGVDIRVREDVEASEE